MVPHQNNYGLLLLGLEANFVNKIFEQLCPPPQICLLKQKQLGEDEHYALKSFPEKECHDK